MKSEYFEKETITTLPLPIRWKSKVFTGMEIQPIPPSALAEALNLSKKSYYNAMRQLAARGAVAFIEENGDKETNEGNFTGITEKMPLSTAMFVLCQIALANGAKPNMKTVVKCPACENVKVYDRLSEGIDLRDNIHELLVNYMDANQENTFIYTFEKPLILKTHKEEIEITSIECVYPELCHYITAEAVSGDNYYTLEYQVKKEIMSKVNNIDLTSNEGAIFRKRYGDKIVTELMSIKDHNKIGELINRYGIQKAKERHCSYCGNTFNTMVSVDDFFGTALLAA